jgi:hypothetical protein
MPAYMVVLSTTAGATLHGGCDTQIVFAADAAAAKEIAAAKYESDGEVWSAATVTQIEADADFEGWTFTVDICGGLGILGDEGASFTYTGTATNNTIDEIAAQLVLLINAHDEIAGSSYDAATNILTVADTTDALGDQTITVSAVPPGYASSVPSVFGTITYGGAAADALTVELPGDSDVIPTSVLSAKAG